MSWAAEREHKAIIKLLLVIDKADVDLEDYRYRQTLLLWVAENRYKAVVRLLLETGKVDMNSKDTRYGQTLLS